MTKSAPSTACRVRPEKKPPTLKCLVSPRASISGEWPGSVTRRPPERASQRRPLRARGAWAAERNEGAAGLAWSRARLLRHFQPRRAVRVVQQAAGPRGADLVQRRLDPAALGEGDRAARVEPAARRWLGEVRRAARYAGERHPGTTDRRERLQQAAAVGVGRGVEA